MAFGVYVHFPYCRAVCPYCDFAVVARDRVLHDEYADAVLHELDARAPLFDGRDLVSIYFGGGTPSLWRPDCVARVIASVRSRWPPSSTAHALEVTLEANPDLLPRAILDGLRAAGVNRLSLGVQSLAPRRLVELARLHGPDEARQAVQGARAAGFDTLSLDLMFALPGQTEDELARELDALVALAPDHVSLYGLTVEERTPFAAYQRRGTLVLPDAERQADLYTLVDARLGAAGFTHYEVSSWARGERRAVHNSLYWAGEEWLGLGASAHSFRRVGDGGERFATVRGLDDYLARVAGVRSGTLDGDALVASRDPLAAADLAREAMWLGLRRVDVGIDRAAFRARHGVDPAVAFAREIAPVLDAGLLTVAGRAIRLTARGVLLADEVGARFV